MVDAGRAVVAALGSATDVNARLLSRAFDPRHATKGMRGRASHLPEPMGQQAREFFCAEVAPMAELEMAEAHVDDAHPLQSPHAVTEHVADAPDLPVQPLRQDDAEGAEP